MSTPFPIDPHQTMIANTYRNKRLIADLVLPRVPVGKEEFRWNEYKLAEGFTVPDTKVGRRSAPNEVSFGATEKTSSTEDYALDDPIPQGDIDQATESHDPLEVSTEFLTHKILLGREARVADLVFGAANYNGNTSSLSGTSRWDDYENSDPVEAITNILDGMIMRATDMAIGRRAFSTLARHPLINKAVHGNSGDAGIASRQQIADLFELEAIHVGEAFVNTANKGQTPSLSRAWGNHVSFQYKEPISGTKHGMTFGFTAQYGDRIAGAMPDSKIGIKGGQRNRVGEQVKEVISAPDCGYLLQTVIS